jgi:hypothetical protein
MKYISLVFFSAFSISAFASTPLQITLTQKLQPCTLSVSPFVKGIDISDNYANFKDPFQFFTNPKYPGVTLPGPDRAKKCNWVKEGDPGSNFTWNAKNEQCILNGAYGYFQGSNCSTGGQLPTNLLGWAAKAKAGATVDVLLTLPNQPPKNVKVMLGFGHGVLNSKCGGVTLVEYNGNYVAVLQVGARAWSYEISQPASTHLDLNNTGGTCMIPNVVPLSPNQASALLEAASVPPVK